MNFGPSNWVRSCIIVWAHDTMGLTFRQIGALPSINCSYVAVHRHYHRWYDLAQGLGYDFPLLYRAPWW